MEGEPDFHAVFLDLVAGKPDLDRRHLLDDRRLVCYRKPDLPTLIRHELVQYPLTKIVLDRISPTKPPKSEAEKLERETRDKEDERAHRERVGNCLVEICPEVVSDWNSGKLAEIDDLFFDLLCRGFLERPNWRDFVGFVKSPVFRERATTLRTPPTAWGLGPSLDGTAVAVDLVTAASVCIAVDRADREKNDRIFQLESFKALAVNSLRR